MVERRGVPGWDMENDDCLLPRVLPCGTLGLWMTCTRARGELGGRDGDAKAFIVGGWINETEKRTRDLIDIAVGGSEWSKGFKGEVCGGMWLGYQVKATRMS